MPVKFNNLRKPDIIILDIVYAGTYRSSRYYGETTQEPGRSQREGKCLLRIIRVKGIFNGRI